jgi:hypothetical protein
MTASPREPADAVAYDGLVVALRSSDPAALAWLREFLGPSFEDGAGRPPGCAVTLAFDEPRYRAARALEQPGPPLDAFSLDRSVLRFRAWSAGDGGLVLRDPSCGVLFEARGGAFTVLAPPGKLAARIGLMRVVRELALGHAARAKGLFLHAAALTVGDRAVLLAGPTASGKTTLLLHALRTGAARYLANDRVRVDLAGRRARGLPTVVTVRPWTRQVFSDLTGRLEAGGYQYRLGLAEHDPGQVAPLRPWRDGRLGLSPAHLVRALGVERAGDAEVAAVVFPVITDAASEPGPTPVSSEDAGWRLETCLLGAGHWQKQSDIFVLPGAGPAPGEAELRARCRTLASSVPCLEWRLGPSAYVDRASAETLLDLAR